MTTDAVAPYAGPLLSSSAAVHSHRARRIDAYNAPEASEFCVAWKLAPSTTSPRGSDETSVQRCRYGRGHAGVLRGSGGGRSSPRVRAGSADALGRLRWKGRAGVP